ncbi:MAG: VOC family protein [Paracoccaceae bacterium]|jgi:lactoylglutathione lyase|tara:strand:- start:147 stop:626 length:480 start_codon:yes stop_codon:yes gene_type:complete
MTTNISPKISGIFETHLTVRNLDRSIHFYRDRLGLTLARKYAERNVAFFWAGQKADGMLGLWETGTGPLHMGLHFAFRVDFDTVRRAPAWLRQQGIEPLDFYGTPTNEPSVIGWMPAVSVYFKDPDGHSLEFISLLKDAANAEFGVNPLSQWKEQNQSR